MTGTELGTAGSNRQEFGGHFGGRAELANPQDFVRALLNISPEDAAEVRESTPGARRSPEWLAARKRYYAADAIPQQFVSTEPITGKPGPHWTQDQQAAYKAAIAEHDAAKAAFEALGGDDRPA